MNCGCSRRIWKRSPDRRHHWLGRGLRPEERQTVLMLISTSASAIGCDRASNSEMSSSAAGIAECNKIFGSIVAQLASRANMMYLKFI